jgi:hypothetical protein
MGALPPLAPSKRPRHVLDEDSLVPCEEWEARCARNSTQDLCALTKSLCSEALWSQPQHLRLLTESTSPTRVGFAREFWQWNKFSRKFCLKEWTVRDTKSTTESAAASDDFLKYCTLLCGIFWSFSGPLRGRQAAVVHKAITAVPSRDVGWSPTDRYSHIHD